MQTQTDALGRSPTSLEANVSPEISIHSRLPQAVVGRLGLYYRELCRLLDSSKMSVNSIELGKLLGVSPAVVRRDLNSLGAVGLRGVGYPVPSLIDTIGRALGSGMHWRVILLGVGSLGDALLRYRGFERLGFQLVAAFDASPDKIGRETGGLVVSDISELEAKIAQVRPELAILAVPAEQALEMSARLVAAGVTGILNFAPITLQFTGGVAVVNVDLASELQRLAFSVQYH
jgi:redox-sensing transcriptional repressor